MIRPGQSALTHIRNGMEISNFLRRIGVGDFNDLENRVNEMNGRLNTTSTAIKAVERKIKTLKEHL